MAGMTEEEAITVGCALATLAIQLTLHQHQWSDCQREAYEQAVAILQRYGFGTGPQERPRPVLVYDADELDDRIALIAEVKE